MGNGALAPIDAKSKKNLVIVGFSYAGFNVAQNVWDYYNVTVIDQNNYFEHICANVKTTVDIDFTNKILHSFEKMAQAYPKIKFQQGRLKQVNTDNSILVEPTAA